MKKSLLLSRYSISIGRRIEKMISSYVGLEFEIHHISGNDRLAMLLLLTSLRPMWFFNVHRFISSHRLNLAKSFTKCCLFIVWQDLT